MSANDRALGVVGVTLIGALNGSRVQVVYWSALQRIDFVHSLWRNVSSLRALPCFVWPSLPVPDLDLGFDREGRIWVQLLHFRLVMAICCPIFCHRRLYPHFRHLKEFDDRDLRPEVVVVYHLRQEEASSF